MMFLIMLIARFLSIDDFGRFSFAFSCANLIILFAEAGLHLILLREMGRATTDRERASIWNQFFILKTFLATVAGVIGAIISTVIWPWGNPVILIAIIGGVIGDTFVEFFHQVCNATGKLIISIRIMLLHRGLCLFFVIVSLTVWPNLFALSIGFLLGGILGALLGFIALKTSLVFISWPKISYNISFSWLVASLPLAWANFLGFTCARLGIFILPFFCRPEELGFYGAAQKLYEAGYMVPAAFMSITVPKLSKAVRDNPNNMGAEIKKMGKYVIGMALFWVILFFLLSEIIIKFLFGENYGPAVGVYRIMVFANALVFVNYYLTHLLVIYNKLAHYAIYESFCVSASFVITFYLSGRYGMRGAAISLIFTEIILFILISLSLLFFLRNRSIYHQPFSPG